MQHYEVDNFAVKLKDLEEEKKLFCLVTEVPTSVSNCT